MERIKFNVQYDGKNFCGWQVQPKGRSVQGELEEKLGFLLGEKVRVYASGRTDAGVSAISQVCHFDTEKNVTPERLKNSLNALLPNDVAVTQMSHAPEGFDARFSVKQKTYQYRFYVSRNTLPLFIDRALRVNDYADVSLMNDACKYFVGTHDFSSFVARKSGKTDFVRTIYDCKIVELGDGLLALEITGNGFLYNMVRIIFGTILQVGYKKIAPEGVKDIISAKTRVKAGKTMPAYALFLKNVEYNL